MKTKTIKLTAVTDVQELVKIVTAFNGDVDLRSGRYLVDAKSIMGIFSLDLSKPIEVIVDNEDGADVLFAKLDKFSA
jgi:phosphotransferase system HPr-like phosphotransfer protein